MKYCEKNIDILNGEILQNIPLAEISGFPNHPFRVREDEEINIIFAIIMNLLLVKRFLKVRRKSYNGDLLAEKLLKENVRNTAVNMLLVQCLSVDFAAVIFPAAVGTAEVNIKSRFGSV